MADSRLSIAALLFAPFALWRFASHVQRYRRDRAASPAWTPALRAERVVFRPMAVSGLGVVLVLAAVANPTTPPVVMNVLWAVVAIGAAIMCLAAVVAGYHRSREAREASHSAGPAA